MGAKRNSSTADRILDTAERLVQERGYNAFSYADISETLGIQKASLHHHFATKADLGLALIERYRHDFNGALRAIEADTAKAQERLERYVALYGSVLRKKRMCMCGMLAAEVTTLPKVMRQSVAAFFADSESWLGRVLDEGREEGILEFEGPAGSMAAFFVSSLEGAMLVARGSGSPEHFDTVAARLLEKSRPRKAAQGTSKNRRLRLRGPTAPRSGNPRSF